MAGQHGVNDTTMGKSPKRGDSGQILLRDGAGFGRQPLWRGPELPHPLPRAPNVEFIYYTALPAPGYRSQETSSAFNPSKTQHGADLLPKPGN